MTWWRVATAAAKAATPPVLQVVADGCWETARVVELRPDAAMEAAAGQVASVAVRDVAVEVLWPGQSAPGCA